MPHLLQKVVGRVRWENIDEKAPQILMITFSNLPLETKKKSHLQRVLIYLASDGRRMRIVNKGT